MADGLVSVLTPISIDHTRLLGNTVESIATEKVGIIKPDAVVVTGVQTHEVMEIIAAETEEKDASLQAEGVAFGVLEREVAVGGQVLSLRGLAGDYTDLFMPLYGAHQAHNAAIAVAAVEAFVGGGEQRLTDEVIRSAFANFSSPGRLEIVRRSPTVLVDAAHNPAGVEALVEAVRESFMFGRLVGVIGVLAEKDAESMIALLEPVLDHIVLTRTTSPRAVSPQRLGEIALGYFGEDRISVIRDLPDALDLAAGMADDGGMSGAVLATGSVVTAAEVRMLLGQSAT
ncbi:glutamate ligase domain-containing protein [Ornithinimicrobium sp. INDO-MA30-4]|uniref:bifunctional folylpolyglutamate synthase/dihydrofolate synthase n=1 Tax=Ornithinimicrobium sp. INDO-MA30-4 TaxID=2908651 RepID=UPI002883433A|nr:cyanophycin synthetase [Ornithinimicrobium sp. INDO-MA30-4]